MPAEPPDVPDRLTPLKTVATHLLVNLRPAIVGLVLLTIVTGILFPLALFGVAATLYPNQAAGSLLRRNGTVVGSAWIGQGFSKPGYFHPRPSAAGNGYDASSSGGTNFGPSNPKLIDAVRQFAQDFRKTNGLASDAEIPIDAVTSSGSGLDPHITPQNANLQIARVARARGLTVDFVRALVESYSQWRQLGVLGEPRVAVLPLNLALDQAAPLAKK
jgi:potassium-transporting ATPase KdpC subunit